ncbi:MAG TPA: SDR family oxidoreductase [Mesorhizobium sp.]|jgi:NAD(P)-dependent dehydrogenase (short-subunit alcohol dehydrogenase family)|nr:SDR family oxidoreductase [Mesorhizobium sp.]
MTDKPLKVMISAAGSGIGLAIAKAFLEAGHAVHICDIGGAAEAAAEAHPGLLATRADVADEAAVDAWFADALAKLGGLDLLINNAGIAGPTAPLEEVDPKGWRECLAVCLDSQFLASRRAIPVLKAQRSGSIINLSSTAGLFGYGLRAPYAAAKWGVIGLTKSLAIELGPWNVRVNAICPGSVAGERMEGVIAREAKARGIEAARVAAEYTSGQSIHRFVEAQEIADLCLFLASPAARMISGQAIAVDGNTETFHISAAT